MTRRERIYILNQLEEMYDKIEELIDIVESIGDDDSDEDDA